MSVVVRMEMPKDCPMCPMAHWNKLDELTGCEVAPGKLFEFSRSKEYRESNTRPDWCPIICQLPEGHGRLIDADANIETMKKCAENPENEQALLCYRYAQRILEEAPTVEPASPWHRVEEDPPNGKEDAIFCYEWTGISGTVYRETSIISLGELIALGYRPIAWMEKPDYEDRI